MYALEIICAFVKGLLVAKLIFNSFSIWINNLMMGLEGSYDVTMVLVASSISLGVMVPYESYRIFCGLIVLVCENLTFSLANPST